MIHFFRRRCTMVMFKITYNTCKGHHTSNAKSTIVYILCTVQCTHIWTDRPNRQLLVLILKILSIAHVYIYFTDACKLTSYSTKKVWNDVSDLLGETECQPWFNNALTSMLSVHIYRKAVYKYMDPAAGVCSIYTIRAASDRRARVMFITSRCSLTVFD